MPKLFFSYSHADEDLRDALEKHLAMLKRQGLIDTIHDRRIPAGAHLDVAIDAYLNEADVILCLLSPDFIASDYCYGREMERALERHDAGETIVIPVLLRHCDWRHTRLAELRGTPRDNKPVTAWPDRDEAWLKVTNDIRAALEARDDAARAAVHHAMPTGPAQIAPHRPRSANLTVTRIFTDLERDRYVSAAFDFIKEYLANSLDDLKTRHSDVEGEVNRLDPHRFTAALYRSGRKASAATVYLGGIMGGGREIGYQLTDNGATNTADAYFQLTNDDAGMGFRVTFGAGQSRAVMLRPDEVAEEIWSVLLRPLQRPA